ncbi:MAG: hypothetical protein FD160_1578 [Caulobacteraceae bacterium]|nr:MAG: hypothetical protein FD160_1578 [Caulobacteraceae bacterium]
MNLETISNRAGDRWPQVAARIREGTVNFLTSRIDEADVVIPCGNGFLVVFAHLDEAGAKRRMAELEQELTGFYAGEEGLAELRARMVHKSMPKSEMVELASPAASARTGSGANLEMTFVPVWSARLESVACFFRAPTFFENGWLHYGYGPQFRSHGSHGTDSFLDFDIALLHDTVARAQRHTASGARSVLGISVHASTLKRSHTRQVYMKQLLAAPQHVMRRMLVKIAEVEVGAPGSLLCEMIRPLRDQVGQVSVEFHHSDRPHVDLHGFGCALAGFQLPHHDAGMSVTQRQILARTIAVWHSILARRHMKLFVDRFFSADLLREVAHGIDFATSDRFWPVRSDAGDVQSSPLAALTADRDTHNL